MTAASKYDTLGFDTATPWSVPALRVLYSAPRVYQPLINAHAGTDPSLTRALDRLISLGFATRQDRLIYDTVTNTPAPSPSRAVPRYRTTNKGTALAGNINDDPRILDKTYPRLVTRNQHQVGQLLTLLALKDSHAAYGISRAHAVAVTGLSASVVKWWISRWISDGLVRVLPIKIADVRELIPAHYRGTAVGTRHIKDLTDTFTGHAHLRHDLRLRRWRELPDINPSRIGITGATDFDHDVNAQATLGGLLTSPRAVAPGATIIEPRLHLPVHTTTTPWTFTRTRTGDAIAYQPDALMRETVNGRVTITALEYERYQSRRDAWSHIERFTGYLHCHVPVTQPGILRFVVESRRREATYVELIEAYADAVLDNPSWAPGHDVTLAVSSRQRLRGAGDTLADHHWFRIQLPQPEPNCTPAPPMHNPEHSPYDIYFKT